MKKLAIFDLDQTLVNTAGLSDLRKTQQWDAVVATLGHANLYPQVEKLLEACRENALKVAIVTSSPKHVAEAVCEYFGIGYDFLIGFRCAKHPKPSNAPIREALKQAGVKPWEAISIGDRCVDVASTREAGIKDPIAALWGAEDPNEALLALPKYCCQTVAEAIDLVSAICRGDGAYLKAQDDSCKVKVNAAAWPSGASDPAERSYIDRSEYRFLRVRYKGPWFMSYANQLVDNVKIGRDKIEEKAFLAIIKTNACNQLAHELTCALPKNAAIAFIPTSKKPDHPKYDDRWEQVAACLRSKRPDIVIHAPLEMVDSTEGVHTVDASGHLRQPAVVRENLRWVGFNGEAPPVIYLIDDVLTTGGHFAACKSRIQEATSIEVHGLFWTVHLSSDLNLEIDEFEGI